MTQIGLGLAALGRPEYINIRENNNIDKSQKAFQQNAFDMLTTAYELGIRYFDTAPSYGHGEYFLKLWQQTNHYQNVCLATKWGYTYVANWQLGYTGKHEIKEHSIEKLTTQWKVSKQMLPHLKVYQIHSATLESGVLENTNVLNKLAQIKKETGLLIGLTTSGVEQKKVLQKATNIVINQQPLFDLFQVTYNVFEQSTFATLIDLVKKGKKVVIKEGVANGRIFKHTPVLLQQLAQKHQTSIDAIALRFVIDSIQPYMVLSGAFSKKQLISNLKAEKIKLSADEIHQLQQLKTNALAYWEERKNLMWS